MGFLSPPGNNRCKQNATQGPKLEDRVDAVDTLDGHLLIALGSGLITIGSPDKQQEGSN
jgi:hypothetical protein